MKENRPTKQTLKIRKRRGKTRSIGIKARRKVKNILKKDRKREQKKERKKKRRRRNRLETKKKRDI